MSFKNPGCAFRRMAIGCAVVVQCMTASAQISNIAPGAMCSSDGTILGTATSQYAHYKPMDVCVDGYGNTYVAGYRQGPNILGNHTFEMHLTKFDSVGNIVWQKSQLANSYSNNDNYRSTFITAVEVDSNKNVYISGSCSTEKLVLDTITLQFGNTNQRGFVAKLDSTGTFVWVTVFVPGGMYNAVTDLELSDNRLYASVYTGGVMRLPNGQNQNMGPNPNITVLTTGGQYIRRFYYDVTQLNPSFAFFNADASWSGTYTQIQVSPRLKLSASGNLAVVGRYKGWVIVGNDTLVPSSNTGDFNTFGALLDTNSGWINAYPVCYTQRDYGSNIYRRIERMPVFTVDGEDNIYYAESWQRIWTSPNGDHDTVFLPDGTPLEGAAPSSSVLMSYDPFGQLLWKSIHSDVMWSTVELNSNGFYAYGSYFDTLLLRSVNPLDSILDSTLGDWQNLVVLGADLNGNTIWYTAYGGTNMDFSYHLRKSRCSDNFMTVGLQSSTAITYNQSYTVTVPLADRIHLIKHSPASMCVDTVCWHVAPPVPTSSPEYSGSRMLSVYPLPASDEITVNGIDEGLYCVSVFDLTGQEVHSFSSTILGPLVFSCSSMADGTYVMHIENSQQCYVTKITVVH